MRGISRHLYDIVETVSAYGLIELYRVSIFSNTIVLCGDDDKHEKFYE